MDENHQHAKKIVPSSVIHYNLLSPQKQNNRRVVNLDQVFHKKVRAIDQSFQNKNTFDQVFLNLFDQITIVRIESTEFVH